VPHGTRARALLLRGCARPGGVYPPPAPSMITCAALENAVAVRLQVSSPKPGRRARGEGNSTVSVRQERGRAGALPTALRAHRV